MSVNSKMKAIADAIRAKTGKTGMLNLDQMASDLNAIPTKAATTITPSISNQTIAAGTYLTGIQTIIGDTDLKEENIKKGVNIFGVDGSYTDLNYEIVGSPNEPSNPTENMIWVNTDVVNIPTYYFQVEQPENMSDGDVWFISDSYGAGVTAFNLSKNNTVMVYPFEVNQMINGTLVVKQAKIWQNNEWVDFTPVSLYLYNSGDTCDDVTGSWENFALRSALTITTIDGGVRLKQNTSGGTGLYKTKNKVSLKGYNSLFFTGIINRPNAYTSNLMGIRIYSDMGDNVSTNVVAEYIPPIKENNIFDDVLMIDISTLNESYYIAFFIQSDNNKFFDLNKLRISR